MDGSPLCRRLQLETLDMPTDAKLGLVVGMGLVIAVAVVFFRRDVLPSAPTAEEVSSIGNRPAVRPPQAPYRGSRNVRAKTTGRIVVDASEQDAVRRHTVAEGDTLFLLAKHYYDDVNRFVDIFEANRDQLQSPEQLTPGTELIIPQ